MSDNVQKITELAINSHEALQPNTFYPTIGLPDNYKVQSLEAFQEFKNKFSGNFKTTSISDFVAYCKSMQSDSNSFCFVDADNMQANIILDIGSLDKPEHGKHRAEIIAKKTIAYTKGILEAIQTSFHQKELFNYLQDWKNNVEVIGADNEAIATNIACQRILKIDIESSQKSSHEVSDFSSQTSAMAQVEAKSKENEQLPKGIMFTCKPYDTLKEYSFFLRLSLKVMHDKPKLVLRCEGLENLKQEMTEEFREKLKAEFGDKVILGTFQQ